MEEGKERGGREKVGGRTREGWVRDGRERGGRRSARLETMTDDVDKPAVQAIYSYQA